MTRTDAEDDTLLDPAFAAARAAPPEPAAGLRARVLALALAEQPQTAPRPGNSPDMSGPFWRELASALGGWWGAGGLTTAMVVGLSIGLAGLVDLPILPQEDAPLELMPQGDGLFADAAEGN